MARHYFLGGNTPKGFFSYYDFLIDREKAKKVYIIKGGPGTGKSTIMKSVANWGEDNGFYVDYLHCSSDPDSLDGIIIDGDIAMVDGTSPHTLDPKYPGCVETIVNMGDFWDERQLWENKEKIIATDKKIKECFAYAYNYLAAAGNIYKNIPVQNCVGKVAQTIFDESCGREKTGKQGRMRKLFASAIGPKGQVSFAETLVMKKCYVLKTDFIKSTNSIMQKTAQIFLENGYDTELFYDPLAPDELVEHICVEEAGVSVLTSVGLSNITTDACVIDVDEIMHTDSCAKEYLHNKLMAETLIKEAVRILSKAKQKHDELEKFYVPCMDFESANQYAKQIMDDIRNNKICREGI